MNSKRILQPVHFYSILLCSSGFIFSNEVETFWIALTRVCVASQVTNKRQKWTWANPLLYRYDTIIVWTRCNSLIPIITMNTCFTQSGLAGKEAHDSKLQKIQHNRLLKDVIVPTSDQEVRMFLRGLKEPVTLFGEDKLERRERLRSLLVGLNQDELEQLQAGTLENIPSSLIVTKKPEGLFFTEGSEELQNFRVTVAKFSLYRAKMRLENERCGRFCIPEQRAETLEHNIPLLTNQASSLADTRPVVSCSFSPGDEYIAVASWSGRAKIWCSRSLEVKSTIEAHEDRLTCVTWHPSFDPSSQDTNTVHLATASVDRTARLWSYNGTQLRILEGHTDRLARIAMHPMGGHLGTCSFDRTWRLWDLELGKCLLEQEGHSRAVYALAFNSDGSLAISCGLDGFARIWDIRTGRSITVLKGHAKAILAVDFNPNGYTVATGSEDHTARIYDLRKRETISVLPGHNSLISQVKFDPVVGDYLMTSGYDNVCKIWHGKRFTLQKTLAGHEGKIMGSDVSRLGDLRVATVGYDRTLKLWEPDIMG